MAAESAPQNRRHLCEDLMAAYNVLSEALDLDSSRFYILQLYQAWETILLQVCRAFSKKKSSAFGTSHMRITLHFV